MEPLVIRAQAFSFRMILVVLAASFVAATDVQAQFVRQGARVLGSGAVGSAFLGVTTAVSSDGNTVITGGFGDASLTGAAWIFTRSHGEWSQQGGKLVGSGAVGAARQGVSVRLSADGNTAVVGGPFDASGTGAAWVFVRSAGVWTQQGPKLVGSGAVGANVQQGTAVAISGDGNTILVGGLRDNALAGATWVFTRSGSTWTQQGAKLVGTGATGAAQQGISLALSHDGSTAAVGGSRDNTDAGAVWVFTRSGTTWSQQGGKLVGSAAVGAARQGYSVALSADGNTLITGARADNASAGAAWVFTRTAGTWSQQGPKLVGSGAVGNAQQGISVSLSADGNLAAIGGPEDDARAGATWLFARNAGTWSQLGSKLVSSDAIGSAAQGSSAALAGNALSLVVGGSDDNAAAGALWGWAALSADAPDPDGNATRAGISLSQARPHPVRTSASIRFVVPRRGPVALRAYDLSGREVRRIVNRVLDAGQHDATFDSRGLPGGVYFVRLEAGGVSAARKLVVEP